MTTIEELIGCIQTFVEENKANAIPECDGLRVYDPPLVAFASARDPLYRKLKEPGVIGPHHLMPRDWIADAATVIVYFLPFAEQIVKSNARDDMSSQQWYLARHYGEVLNDALRDHVVETLRERGFQAVAPIRTERFEMQLASSNWSERHSAYIAGLGTFCLSYALITEKGCAGRYGSVVTNLEIPPSPRTAGLRDHCLYDEKGTCGRCIPRCPTGAIRPEGKDHMKCLDFILNKVVPEHGPRHNIFVGGCGMCQANVPCDRRIPRKSDLGP